MRIRPTVLVMLVVCLIGCSQAPEPAPSETPPAPSESESAPIESSTSPTETPDADLPMLLVAAHASDGYGDARISGVLELNEQGCVTIRGELLLAPVGSSVTESGEIVIAGFAPLAIGDTFDGGGGHSEWPSAAELGAVFEGAEQCVAPGAESIPTVGVAPAEYN